MTTCARTTQLSWAKLTVALLIALGWCTELSALSVKPMSLSALIKRSTLIIHGRVIGQEVTQRASPSGRPWIFTLSTIEVQECWRAETPCPKRLIVSQIGGTLPSRDSAEPPLTLAVPGLPTLKHGAHAGLFLTPKSDPPPSMYPVYVVVGGAQGARVAQEEQSLTDLRQEVLHLVTQEAPTTGSIAPKP